jgi:hypothetical protein
MPSRSSSALGPIPERSRIAGEQYAPSWIRDSQGAFTSRKLTTRDDDLLLGLNRSLLAILVDEHNTLGLEVTTSVFEVDLVDKRFHDKVDVVFVLVICHEIGTGRSNSLVDLHEISPHSSESTINAHPS